MASMKATVLKSFKPFADDRSRILILGSMPGPVALKKKEYYGFPGNLFWKILPDALGAPRPKTYREKILFLKENRIALWDTIASCTRVGASDSSIRCVKPNNIAGLIKRRRNIRTIFVNGKTAEKIYKKEFRDTIRLCVYTLPSTSPAHASMSYEKKLEKWKIVKKYLDNRNPWC